MNSKTTFTVDTLGRSDRRSDQARTSGGSVPSLGMCYDYGQTLDPLLRVLASFRLQDQRVVSGEDLKCLRNIPRPSAHLDAADLMHVDRSHVFVVFL